MRRVEGVIEELDLGAGGLALRTPGGARYLLHGEISAELVGREVIVEGEVVEAAGFLMTGDPTLRVTRVATR
ncbi:MAG: hypothetical protein EA397_10535 [Deltaproteobacteria bacterium]|nr:MAG: hypothetical protein EA397_10535 [Deltaproteobacteria bacterium]